MTRRRQRSGMTLIEVLAALAILGIGLAVLIQSVARCLAVVHTTRNYETARYLLQRLDLEHPLGVTDPIVAGPQDGRFDPPNDDFTWSREITAIGEELLGAPDTTARAEDVVARILHVPTLLQAEIGLHG